MRTIEYLSVTFIVIAMSLLFIVPTVRDVSQSITNSANMIAEARGGEGMN